jgi:hypothetical protein
MITSNKGLAEYIMINPVILGGGVDLSKLTPAQLYALGAGLAAGANAPAAGMKKIKGGQKPKPKPKPKAPVSIP